MHFSAIPHCGQLCHLCHWIISWVTSMCAAHQVGNKSVISIQVAFYLLDVPAVYQLIRLISFCWTTVIQNEGVQKAKINIHKTMASLSYRHSATLSDSSVDTTGSSKHEKLWTIFEFHMCFTLYCNLETNRYTVECFNYHNTSHFTYVTIGHHHQLRYNQHSPIKKQ